MNKNVYEHKGKKIDNEIINASHQQILTKAKKFKAKTFLVGTQAISKIVNFYCTGKIENITKLIACSEFFYFPWRILTTQVLPPIGDLSKKSLIDYNINHEEKMKEVLMLNKTFNLLRSEIEEKFEAKLDDVENLAKANDANAIRLLSKIKCSFQYKKFRRLNEFYNLLIEFTLKIFHLFYWNDFQEQINVPEPLEDLIPLIMPKIINLKEFFEEFVSREHDTEKLSELNNINA